MQTLPDIEHTSPDGTRRLTSPSYLRSRWRNHAEAQAAITMAEAGQRGTWTTPAGPNTVRAAVRPDPIIPHAWASLLYRANKTRSCWGFGVPEDETLAATELVRRGWLDESGMPEYIDAPALVVNISEAGRAVLAAYDAVEDAISG